MPQSVSNELKFLLQRTRTAIREHCFQEVPSKVQKAEFSDIDAAYLLRLVRAHGLGGVLLATFSEDSELSQTSSKFRWFKDALRRDQRNFSDRSRIFSAELLRATSCLAKARIRAIPFKGPVLESELYGGLGLRPYSDLDVYVPARNIPLALKTLAKEGWNVAIDLSPRQLRYLIQSESQIPLTSKYSGLDLELHWGLRYGVKVQPGLWPKALKRKCAIKHAGKTIAALPPEDLFVTLILHGHKHRWESLKWLLDLVYFKSTHPEINTAYVLKALNSLGATESLELANCLIGMLFGTEFILVKTPISNTTKELTHKIIWQYDSESKAQGWQKIISEFKVRQSGWKKLSYICASLFRPRQPDILLIDLPIILSPLYVPIRLVRLVARFILGPILIPEAASKAEGGSKETPQLLSPQ